MRGCLYSTVYCCCSTRNFEHSTTKGTPWFYSRIHRAAVGISRQASSRAPPSAKQHSRKTSSLSLQ